MQNYYHRIYPRRHHRTTSLIISISKLKSIPFGDQNQLVVDIRRWYDEMRNELRRLEFNLRINLLPRFRSLISVTPSIVEKLLWSQLQDERCELACSFRKFQITIYAGELHWEGERFDLQRHEWIYQCRIARFIAFHCDAIMPLNHVNFHNVHYGGTPNSSFVDWYWFGGQLDIETASICGWVRCVAHFCEKCDERGRW